MVLTLLLTLGSLAAAEESKHAGALLERDVLTGEWGGARPAQEDRGVTFGIHYTQEILGVVSGGLSRGSEYNGLFELDFDLDLEKAIGWKGAALHASGYAAAGESISARHVGDDGNVSNINMRNPARLFELWLEQKYGDAFAIRFGMLADDSQFYDTGGDAFGSRGGLLFMNSDFGAMPLMSFNVPEPIWPVPAPGVCLTAKPTSSLTLRAAVYDGQPVPIDDADRRNLHGTAFRLNSADGALCMIEAALAVNQPAPADGKSVTSPRGLAGLYKVGAFYHTGTFTRWSSDQTVQGDGGGYATADQLLWRENDRDNKGLSIFGRAGAAPRDRNVLDLDLEAGFDYRGLLPGRDNDTLGLAVAAEHYSRDFSASERRAGNPARDHETVIEFTYRAQFAPWLCLQPDMQYVVHPAGQHATGNALVVGVRMAMDF